MPIILCLDSTESTATVTIHNVGPRIAEDFIERIFEYGVPDQAEAGAHGNRGQGLFVARTYMAKMGGHRRRAQRSRRREPCADAAADARLNRRVSFPGASRPWQWFDILRSTAPAQASRSGLRPRNAMAISKAARVKPRTAANSLSVSLRASSSAR